MYRYETHLHTSPVSRCARASVEETLRFYKSMGYDGVFITNHFLDGNINISPDKSYEERIGFYFSDYEAAARLAPEIGIKVFCGVEISFCGTDFLVYGVEKAWFLEHPDFLNHSIREKLALLRDAGAFLVQAHPYREAGYIDHIRLMPRDVEAVEVINASQPDAANDMASIYAAHYELLPIAGSDNHFAGRAQRLAGICTEEPLNSVAEFISALRQRKARIFTEQVPPISEQTILIQEKFK